MNEKIKKEKNIFKKLNNKVWQILGRITIEGNYREIKKFIFYYLN